MRAILRNCADDTIMELGEVRLTEIDAARDALMAWDLYHCELVEDPAPPNEIDVQIVPDYPPCGVIEFIYFRDGEA